MGGGGGEQLSVGRQVFMYTSSTLHSLLCDGRNSERSGSSTMDSRCTPEVSDMLNSGAHDTNHTAASRLGVTPVTQFLPIIGKVHELSFTNAIGNVLLYHDGFRFTLSAWNRNSKP